jgi:cell division protein FtsB
MRKKKKLGFKRIIIVFASFYVGYILISTQITMLKLKKEIEVKYQDLSKLQDKNQKLQDEVDMSKTDSYIEKLARERLGLIKPGETLVVEKK